MAKQISQKTFDDVVRENMSEFDMGVEEALQDAISQFESQGVNLTFIVRDPSLYASSNGEAQEHPVLSALTKLSALLDNPTSTSSELSDSLRAIQAECDTDIARRYLAGSNGAYQIFHKALARFKDQPETLNSVLLSFCALVNGQPDLIDGSGIELLISLLKSYQKCADADTLELVIRAIRLNCIKHEKNRGEFVDHGLIGLLTELLMLQSSSSAAVKEICVCLRALTLDDDVRVPFGKSTDNAKAIVTEGDALRAILQLCEEYRNDTSVLGELFLTLSCLAIRDEFCREVLDRGGVSLIVKAFQSAIDDRAVVRQALIVLKSLAGNDDVKCEIAKLDGIELIATAMNKYQNNAQVAEAACRVLTNITLRNVDNCRRVVQCQGHEQIVQVMKLHPQEVGVQKYACMALRNLVSRSKELCDCILSLGAESILNTALTSHKEVEDEAKAALRDLGCKVELRELWKGQMEALH